MSLKFNSLDILKREISLCVSCDLCKSRKNAVHGQGNNQADIMFIGEAPGRTEDEYGEPFVGIAGKILDEILKKVGIDRSIVYITNVVKCRPPANRIPTKDEVAECKHFLDNEISLVCPKIICILGRTAYNSIIGGKSIVQNHGKFVIHEGRKYFLAIHPAAIIYNSKLRLILENDLLILSKECRNLGFIK